jgi:putative transposase
VRHPFDPQHVPARLAAGPGRVEQDLRPIYTAVNATAARATFDDLVEKWGARYPAIVRLWDNAWQEFIPFLDYDVEIRTVLCSTNAIESLNARYRKVLDADIEAAFDNVAQQAVMAPVWGPESRTNAWRRWSRRF